MEQEQGSATQGEPEQPDGSDHNEEEEDRDDLVAPVPVEVGPSFLFKRRCSFSVIYGYMFLAGIEYAIVFPTLWEYLKSLGVKESQTFYLGLSISCKRERDVHCQNYG